MLFPVTGENVADETALVWPPNSRTGFMADLAEPPPVLMSKMAQVPPLLLLWDMKRSRLRGWMSTVLAPLANAWKLLLHFILSCSLVSTSPITPLEPIVTR